MLARQDLLIRGYQKRGDIREILREEKGAKESPATEAESLG